jgi:glucose-1-phosphate adenylyltransferase
MRRTVAQRNPRRAPVPGIALAPYGGAMPAAPKVFGIILAGGEGKRLMPLTADRAKPAVPFGGQYRLIDFAISNLINSGLRQLVVLTQYKSHSLDRHISQTWRMSPMLGSYVASVPAQQRLGKRWFSGSADAILQSMNLIRDEKPDIVVVIGADHVYRMDFAQMLDVHIASDARATIAGIRQPISLANQFGVIDTDPSDPTKIREFLEKPQNPTGLADAPHEVLASMGNYIFDADALVEAVAHDGELPTSAHDMGGDIVPYFVNRGEAAVYDFQRNDVPGSTPRDRSYWRDVGTIESFYDAHMDLISTLPVFNLYNDNWPIFSQTFNAPPAKFVRDSVGRIGNAIDSIVSLGSVLSGTHLERSVVGPWALAGGGSTITDSVLFDGVQVGAGARIHRAILDKNVTLAPGATIGVDRERDLARGFTVTETGITVVGKDVRVEV